MIVRLIVVELAEDTDAESCGSCKHIGPLALSGRISCVPLCRVYDEQLGDDESNPIRLAECRESEARAARMVAISPEDAIGVSIAPRSYHRTDIDAADRVRDALRNHAKKGGGDV